MKPLWWQFRELSSRKPEKAANDVVKLRRICTRPAAHQDHRYNKLSEHALGGWHQLACTCGAGTSLLKKRTLAGLKFGYPCMRIKLAHP